MALFALALATPVVASELDPPAEPRVYSLFHRVYAFPVDAELAFYVLEDSFPVENTIDVVTDEVPLVRGVDYAYDYRANTIQFTPPLSRGTAVEVRYDRVDLGLDRVTTFGLFAIDPAQDTGDAPPQPGAARAPFADQHGAPDVGLLNVTGSKTFGVSAGNNRSFAPDQSLQLRMDGEILPGLRVSAALSDQQLPIQPEGTTADLSRLDQVLIRIEGHGVSAALGDDEAGLEGPELVLFNRAMQGMRASGRSDLGSVQVVVALPKGFSASERMVGVEGQSEYRVTAAGRFVAMVAGSETVWLNGVRMTRGEGSDYVIREYGDPVVEFTAQHLITRNDIVRVDFDYIPENEGWQRNLYAVRGGVNLLDSLGEVGVSYATESDDISRAFAPLSESDIGLLRAGVTQTEDGRALTAPLRREVFGLDTLLSPASGATVGGEIAFHRLHGNTYAANASVDEGVAWRLAGQMDGRAGRLDVRGRYFDASYEPIGGSGRGRTRVDYSDSFADDGYGDALLGTGYAAAEDAERPAEGSYEVEAALAPHTALSATATAGITTEGFVDDARDSENRNVGASVAWTPSALPSLRGRRRDTRVTTGGRGDFLKSDDTVETAYTWRSLTGRYSYRRFAAEDLDVADGANRNRRQNTQAYALETSLGAQASAALRLEREDESTREPVFATEDLAIGFGGWEGTSRARTTAVDVTTRPAPWADVTTTFARRQLERLRNADGEGVTSNIASLEAGITPLRRALDLGARYALDKRLASRREEIYTNVVLIDEAAVQLKPGQGAYVKIDEFHYVEDRDEGEYVRVIRTVGDTPVTALEGQFRARIDPSRLLAPASRTRPVGGEEAEAPPPESAALKALAAFTCEVRWNVTEEQEDAALGDLVALRGLLSDGTVFGRQLVQYRLNANPARAVSADVERTERRTVNRRVNNLHRRFDSDMDRLRLRWAPGERWSFEWSRELRASAETLRPGPSPDPTQPGPTTDAFISNLTRDEQEQAVTARLRIGAQFTAGLRLNRERETAEELAGTPTVGRTAVDAVEFLGSWLAVGRGRADVTYRLGDGSSEGELPALSGFRFYPGFSHEVTARADYRVRSFTDLTFRLNYRMLATRDRPTEHRFDLELVAEL
ncbi:hypothetical protein HN371_22315 [Candidatus Poribacteria bacterium]|nr:hypothetical protein [Candidatus Poribacteria bacterium]MBT7807302.1 hypothetical protein [Candidatus Poribacteria bacterium]